MGNFPLASVGFRRLFSALRASRNGVNPSSVREGGSQKGRKETTKVPKRGISRDGKGLAK